MKPQHERILQYMDVHGSITPMEAFSELGITKLSTRIGEMIASGISISSITKKTAAARLIGCIRTSPPSDFIVLSNKA